MKMKQLIAFLLAVLMLFGCLSGCAKKADEPAEETVAIEEPTEEAVTAEEPAAEEAEEEPDEEPAEEEAAEEPAEEENSVTITDDSGRMMTIDLPVEKVVILDTSPFEVLCAFDKLDVVAGNHQATEGNDLYDALSGLPTVATHSEINYEMLAELQPQVVLSSVRAHGVVTEQENLSGFDIEDVKLNLRNPDTMRSDVKLMGQIFECEDKAAEIIAFYDKWENFITERVGGLSDEERVKVFVEYHSGNYKTGAPDSRFYSQVVLAGGINIAQDLTVGEEPEVSAEWVAEMNPDVIIREASGMGYTAENTDAAKEIYDELMSREGLSMTNAVQNKNVHLVSVDAYSRPGYIIGVCYMAKWFYPEAFEDFNPEDVLQEYFELFHPGKEVKGIWTYDE